jgi:ankyrin repeat protein
LNIWEATATGQLARVQQLLDADPDLLDSYSPDGFWPLGLAVFFRHRPLIDYLLSRGARLDGVARNPMKVTVMHAVTNSKDVEVARLLLERGADVNARQQAGWAPLHTAAANGDEAMARLLLAHGADRAARTDDGKTPGDLAVANGHAALGALLA